uniref:Putative farnesoic acid o-methyltransferase-like protein n=3 Tax=Nyssorhynchus TaxID=44543 RepID=A0A2M4A2F0_9DIPT
MVTGKMGSAAIQFILGFLLHQGFLQHYVYGNIKLETEYDPGYRFVAGADGECNFKVRAASDLDIELSADYAQTRPVVEILIGGENNTKSQIQSGAGALVEKPTPAILSAKEFRSFWIHWNDYAVTVGKKGSEEPILIYAVEKISPMKVISIGTNAGVSDSWVIDKASKKSPATNKNPPTPIPTPIPTRGTPPPVTTPKPPAKWFKTYGNHVPSNAIPAGRFDGTRVQVIGRAWYKNNLIPGAVVDVAGVCYVAWHGQSHYVSNYEVLVDTKGKFVETTYDNIPPNALRAGHTEKGEDLYICRADYKGMKLLGKAHKSHKTCYVGYRGVEHGSAKYEIYVY